MDNKDGHPRKRRSRRRRRNMRRMGLDCRMREGEEGTSMLLPSSRPVVMVAVITTATITDASSR